MHASTHALPHSLTHSLTQSDSAKAVHSDTHWYVYELTHPPPGCRSRHSRRVRPHSLYEYVPNRFFFPSFDDCYAKVELTTAAEYTHTHTHTHTHTRTHTHSHTLARG